MIRLRKADFEDAAALTALAKVARLGAGEFRRQFEYVTEDEPGPLVFVGG